MVDHHEVGVGMIANHVMELTTNNRTISMPCLLKPISKLLLQLVAEHPEEAIAGISTSKRATLSHICIGFRQSVQLK